MRNRIIFRMPERSYARQRIDEETVCESTTFFFVLGQRSHDKNNGIGDRPRISGP